MSPSPSRPADTARLTFRSWRDDADDLALARALWGDRRVTQLIARDPLDDAAIQQRMHNELERERTLGYQYWLLFARDDGAHVGCCGLKPRDLTRNIIELGFHLRPDQWGKGYATE